MGRVQAKQEHLAAIEAHKRIREEMYRQQLEQQAKLEAEARAEVRHTRPLWLCVTLVCVFCVHVLSCTIVPISAIVVYVCRCTWSCVYLCVSACILFVSARIGSWVWVLVRMYA